jgi:peptidoglycan/xylan/chitin deacetylase (PgdA/CDA1 family)
MTLSQLPRRAVRGMLRHTTGPIGSVRQVSTTAPHIVLTFDDGPDDTGTERVLAALDRFGATATFFVLVPRARRRQTLLKEIVAAGHEIGLHGIDHRNLTRLPAAEVLRRTRAGKAELEDLLGSRVVWFRPPYGAQLLSTWWAIRRCDLMSVVWGPTPADWRDVSEREMAASAMEGSGPGAIVLAHDGFAGPQDGVDDGPPPPIDRGLLATLMLEGFAERGLAGRSLAAALATGGSAVRWAWFRRE